MMMKIAMVLFLMSFIPYSMGHNKLAQPEDEGCIYVIKTQTADQADAATTARVRINLCSDNHYCFLVLNDIQQYGDRGPNYAYYFRRAAYSTFEIRVRDCCAKTCKIIVGHNGIGAATNWRVDYMEVEAKNIWGARQSYSRFPIYGMVPAGHSVTSNQCPILREDQDQKTQDLEAAPTFTRIFTQDLALNVAA